MEKQLPKGRTQAETVWKNQKQLRSGYTTGSCAAAAAKAAAYMLLSKEVITQGLVTVNGEVDTRRGRKLYPEDLVSFDEYDIAIQK